MYTVINCYLQLPNPTPSPNLNLDPNSYLPNPNRLNPNPNLIFGYVEWNYHLRPLLLASLLYKSYTRLIVRKTALRSMNHIRKYARWYLGVEN